MAKTISIASTLTVLALAAPVAAQAPAPAAAPAQAEPTPYEPAAAPAPPTVEALQLELRDLKARHEQQLGALTDQLARHEEQSAVVEEREAIERERTVRIYGFADMGIMRTLPPEEGQLASQFTVPLTFYLGRLNLYFDSKPAQHFRFLAETRLSMYPSGSIAGYSDTGQILRTSTVVADVAGPDQTTSTSWGGIILERAALDWTRYPFLSIRAGLFLTPFGIYNVDHGTPTLIAVSLPIYISQRWIPVRQTGLQVFGIHPIERWELGYAATVSNGRSDGVLDVGDSKSYGGRIFMRRQGALRLQLGASALYEPYRRDREQFGMNATGITYTRTREVERTFLAVGVDQSLDYLGLRVRNELVYFEGRYSSGKREQPAQAMGGFAPDSRLYNWSIIVAHRWHMIEPYIRSELFWGWPQQLGTAWAPGAGFNVYLRPNVIVKAGWTNPRFYRYVDGQNTGSNQNFHSFVGILTWAF